MKNNYKLGSFFMQKKGQTFINNEWKIIRIDVNIKIKCTKCGREVMLDRLEFEKKLKKVLGEENGK